MSLKTIVVSSRWNKVQVGEVDVRQLLAQELAKIGPAVGCSTRTLYKTTLGLPKSGMVEVMICKIEVGV